MRTTIRRTLAPAGWSVGSQALSSLSSLVLSLAVARSSSVEEFGAFGVAYSVYIFFAGSFRALVAEPLMIHHSGVPAARHNREGAVASGLVVGVTAAIVLLAITAFVPSPYQSALLFLGATVPVLLLFDGLRYALFAERQPRAAFWLDCGWLAAQFVTFFAMWTQFRTGGAWFVLWWGLSAGAAAAVALIVSQTPVQPRSGLRWIRENRGYSGRYLIEYCSIAVTQQTAVFATVGFAGASGNGALRGAQTVLGPINVLTAGTSLAVLPSLSRLAQRAPSTVLGRCLVLAGCLATGVGVSVALLSNLPGNLGELVLGATWTSATAVIFPLGLAMAVNQFAYGATLGIRLLGRADVSLRIRLVTTPVAVATIIVGATAGGAAGTAWGMALGAAIACIAWWVTFLALHRSTRPRNVEDYS